MSSISDVSMTDFGGRKEGYGGILIGVAAICLFTSSVLMVTGFSAPYWIEGETADGTTITTTHRGLWQHCTEVASAAKTCDATLSTSEEVWFRVCQGVAVLALAALICGSGIFLYWACSHSRYYFNKVLVLCTLLMEGVMAVAMVIVFGVEYDDNFSGYNLRWSFYCYCAGGLLNILAIPFIALAPSFELEPMEGGPRHRRFTAPRHQQAIASAPVVMPAVHPSAVIPKPVPLIAPTPPTVYRLPSSLFNSLQQPTQTQQSSRPAAKKNDYSWVKTS